MEDRTNQIEVILVVGILIFGLVFTFVDHIFTNSSLYAAMLFIAPQIFWGVTYLILGILRAVGIYKKRIQNILRIFSLLLVWLPFTISFWFFAMPFIIQHDNTILPGCVLAPIIALLESTMVQKKIPK